MQTLSIRSFLALGVLCIFALFGCNRTPKPAAIPPGSTVLAFGDSVTIGYGVAPGEDWPSLLAAATGWKITNAGISGDTAENGKDRIEGLLEQHKPALVIVEIGGNDFLHHRSQKAVKEDLRQIIASIRRHGAQPVLVAVPELSVFAVVADRAADAPLYAELGKEEKVPVIADVFSQILSKPELCNDKIHPNAQGYRQMAAGFQSALIEFGLLK